MTQLTFNEVKTEMTRRKSHRNDMLALFKLKGELTTGDLQAFGTGLSGRLSELRKAGHSIVAIYEKPGLYRYVYLGDKSADNSSVSVID